MCTTTPRQELILPARVESAVAAREWARQSGCREHTVDLLDDTLLLLSELVTNAVLHGGPPIVVGIDCDETVMHVRVRDGSPALPVPREADLEAEGGRGMTLVELLTSTWGVVPIADEHGLGKEVWFELRR